MQLHKEIIMLQPYRFLFRPCTILIQSLEVSRVIILEVQIDFIRILPLLFKHLKMMHLQEALLIIIIMILRHKVY